MAPGFGLPGQNPVEAQTGLPLWGLYFNVKYVYQEAYLC